MLVARHIEPRGGEARVSRCREVEIFAVLIETRIDGIAHSICNLRSLSLLERIYEHRMQAARELPGVCDPLTVWSPGLAELRRPEASKIIGVNQLRLSIVEIDIPEIQSLVGISNLLAVGRPHRAVEKRRRIPQIDMPHLAQAVLGAYAQFVFDALIREVGN